MNVFNTPVRQSTSDARSTDAQISEAQISIVVPTRAGEQEWFGLFDQLAAFTVSCEIILSTAQALSTAESARFHGLAAVHTMHHTQGSAGRAAQLNRGVTLATRKLLWFLHADSRLTLSTFVKLVESFTKSPQAVHYSALRFRDGSEMMRVTELGVAVRSRLFKMPFGDQGLAITRANFDACGGFDESANYGEDHLLVWAARRRGLSIRCTGGTLETSATKYIRHGWLGMTARHGYLTWKQALSELCCKERDTP